MKGIITTFITLSVAMCGAKSVFHRPLGAAIPLILGQCEAGHVDSQEWTMYSLNVTRTTLHDGQIIVVPLAGDPDLYARVGAEPTLSNHDYKSLSLSGNESISFFKNDTPLVERCITQCVLYIGVHGFQTTRYLLSSMNQGPMWLSWNLPTRGQLGSSKQIAYRFYKVKASTELNFTVMPISGDPDMFITDDGALPNITYHKWYSAGLDIERVTVPAKSCGAEECLYMVAVSGFGGIPTSWTIVVEAPIVPVVLIDSKPYLDNLDELETSYFSFTIDSSTSLVYFTVLPLHGNPDMYITTDGSKPSRTHYDFRSKSTGGQELVSIARSDPKNKCGSAKCTLLAAIYAVTTTEYYITATASSAEPVTELHDGESIQGTVVPGQYDYFALPVVSDNFPIRFDLTPSVGDPDLVVGCGSLNRPTISNNYWMSISTGIDSIVVHPGDAHYCPTPSYYCTTSVCVASTSPVTRTPPPRTV